MAAKRSGTGLVTVRQLRGLGSLKNPKSLLGAGLPPLIGGGATAAVMLATRHWAKPMESETQRQLFRWAPLVGMGGGALASLGLYWVGGAPAMISSMISSAAVTSAALMFDYMIKDRIPDVVASVSDVPPVATEPVLTEQRGFGVVVPQRIAGVRGILMEPAASRDPVQRYGLTGAYGEDVNLRGAAINPGAFGTPGFGN